MNIFERLNLKGRWNNFVIAMFTTKSIIINKYAAIQDNLDEHLAKVILYGNKDNFKYKNHWTSEIFNFLNSVQKLKLKSSNKYPSADFIKEWLFSIAIDSESNFEWQLEVMEAKLRNLPVPYPEPRKINLESAYTKYKSFVDKCCKDMEKGELTLYKTGKYLEPLFNLK